MRTNYFVATVSLFVVDPPATVLSQNDVAKRAESFVAGEDHSTRRFLESHLE
jgi:hypothetical protein